MKKLQNSETSIIHVDQPTSNDGGRDFSYTLNKKKTKAKLLRGAKRTKNLDIEIKSGCANL